MKCRHCPVGFHPKVRLFALGKDVEGQWGVERYVCPNPECEKSILFLVRGVIPGGAGALM